MASVTAMVQRYWPQRTNPPIAFSDVYRGKARRECIRFYEAQSQAWELASLTKCSVATASLYTAAGLIFVGRAQRVRGVGCLALGLFYARSATETRSQLDTIDRVVEQAAARLGQFEQRIPSR